MSWLAALGQEGLAVSGWLPGCRAAERLSDNASLGGGFVIESARPVANLGGPVDQLGHAVFVEIDVGKRGEDGLDGEGVDLRVGRAQLAGAVRVLAMPLTAWISRSWSVAVFSSFPQTPTTWHPWPCEVCSH